MNDGHVLTGLWKQYEEASKADRPLKEAEILSKIKKEALEKHLPVDFYDAATLYVNTMERRDWKQRDQLRSTLQKEVADFDEPIVTFHWMNSWQRASTDALWTYVEDHLDGFQGHTPAFYRDISGYLGGTLKPFIANDKEYVLWCVLRGRRYTNIENDEMYQLLLEEIKGKYPNEPALEYYALTTRYYPEDRREERRQALAALAGKYGGKAVSLYPRADLLSMQKTDLDKQKASGEAYKALYDSARRLEDERKAFKGTEADIAAGCKYPGSLIATLTASHLRVNVADGNIAVVFQNLPRATVTLRREDKTVKSWKVENPIGSFYVEDTLTLSLPKLADGDYTVEAVSGKLQDMARYAQYTLSIATRNQDGRTCVYVADYDSGEPLKTVKLELLKNGKVVAGSNLRLDGFTPLPDALVKEIGKNKKSYFYLQAVSGDRKSREVYTGDGFTPRRYDDHVRCSFYKDQGAYNPGDTVRFKAVIFKGDPAASLQVCAGKEVEIRLHDSEDNILESQKLTTNEWGSVSGSFVLPTGLRNGRFELEAVGLGYDWFRVDEFVLPTFDLTFDSLDQLYMTGDEVPVSGKLVSYSGHPLSGSTIVAKVQYYDTVVFEENVPVADDNTFRFTFPTPASGTYFVDLTVTDATGETRSFGNTCYVGEVLNLSATVDNDADAELIQTTEDEERFYWRRRQEYYTLLSPALDMCLEAKDGDGNRVPLNVQYKLFRADGSLFTQGEVPSGEKLSLTLPGDGFYRMVAAVSATKKDGKVVKEERVFRFYCFLPESRSLMPEARRVFLPGPLKVDAGAAVTARVGSNEGPAHLQLMLYTENGKVLETKQLVIPDGKLETISFTYKDTYPDAVRLQIFYFQHGRAITYDWQYSRAQDRYTMPIRYTRFQDKAYPGSRYSFTLKTAPDAEVLVAAWDKSLDAIASNYWPLASNREFTVDRIGIDSVCGSVGGGSDRGGPILMRGAMAKGAVVENEALLMADAAPMTEESATPFQLVEEKPAFGTGFGEEVKVRSDFASALTFQPHLRPAADGTLEFSFSTADKLSTYYVRALAHDASMRNALVEQEMVVSLPVKVSLLEPRFLYVGDVYDAAVSVSSVADEAVSGTMALVLSSAAGETSQQLPVTVKPGESVTHRFRVSAEKAGEYVFKAIFKAADFSDAVQVTVPVYPAAQQLTEAHSAVLRAGMSRDELLQELRGRFVNVPASAVELKEITVLDMVRDAIPSHVEPSGKDVLSLSEAWYIRLMAGRLTGNAPEGTEELLEKVLACRNADGGFGWFEGMHSSPVITAVLLERFAKLSDRGFEVPDVTSSVKYLDKRQFDDSLPYWRGYISDAQYLYVRSLYAAVPFGEKPVSAKEKKRFSEFQKWAKAYLLPSKKDGRGLQGQILAKARRLLTLRNLLERDGGSALAKAWGVSAGSSMSKSLKADVTSLLEYAVEHRDGGWYYPNAVMPWRGLMESEAYAHALLCDLFAEEGDMALSSANKKADATERAKSPSEIADGIRLWLMLQKETQHWDTEPAYIDAITAILDGSEAVLATRVLALSGSYEAPFDTIKASGNGFKIERKFYKTGSNDQVSTLVEIQPGEPLAVGDRILVKYLIWNGENRSFVRVTAGREATLQPVQQLSGHLGYGFYRPYGSYHWSFVPQGYRNVKASATEYYFDSYPEENTSLSEEFYVQQAGRFVAPVLVIESLYAPHYRANSAYRLPLEVMGGR